MKLPEKGITGIYKITSLKGKVYIGQAKCIRERWLCYKRLACKYQPKLYSSLKKHGIKNHKFEVIHVCEIEELNRLERYYQDFYDVLSKNGLNLTLQDADDLPRVMSKETRLKISAIKSEIKGLDVHNSILVKIKRINSEIIHEVCMKEACKLIGITHVVFKKRFYDKCIYTNRDKMSDWIIINPMNENKKVFSFFIRNFILDLETGIYYYEAGDLAKSLNMTAVQINRMFSRNKTDLIMGRYLKIKNER